MRPTVAIVGGGPAGLIAAETLARAGAAVTVFEQRRSVARKLILAGRGGLNITHSEPLELLLDRYGPARAALEPAIVDFPPDALRSWCASLGQPTFVGTSGRVFPEAFRATPLVRSWLGRLRELEVTLSVGHRWAGWDAQRSLLFAAGDETFRVKADAAVFALGGASWPRVGSDGHWVDSFRAAGVEVRTLMAANCGVRVAWTPVFRDRFAGEPVKNAVFRVGGRSARGDAVVTAHGLEGGPIYGLGPAIRAQLAPASPLPAAHGAAELLVDLHPDSTAADLTDRLSKRRPKASATSWLRSAGIASLSVALAREATGNALPDEPGAMASLLKSLPVRIDDLATIDRAISSAGGVAFTEIDQHFMLVRRPGTFMAGEMLDWEAPTGGYLLQACFSTGVAAAGGVLAWLQERRPQ